MPATLYSLCSVQGLLHTNQLNTKPGRRFDEFFDPNIGYTNDDVADADTEAVSVIYTLVHLHTCIHYTVHSLVLTNSLRQSSKSLMR